MRKNDIVDSIKVKTSWMTKENKINIHIKQIIFLLYKELAWTDVKKTTEILNSGQRS